MIAAKLASVRARELVVGGWEGGRSIHAMAQAWLYGRKVGMRDGSGRRTEHVAQKVARSCEARWPG